VKSGALVEKLGGVEVQVAEGREDEAALGDLDGVRPELAIVRAEAEDETVAAHLCRQGVSVRRGEMVIADQ